MQEKAILFYLEDLEHSIETLRKEGAGKKPPVLWNGYPVRAISGSGADMIERIDAGGFYIWGEFDFQDSGSGNTGVGHLPDTGSTAAGKSRPFSHHLAGGLVLVLF